MAGLLDKYLDPNVSYRGALLPLARMKDGSMSFAWPGALLDVGRGLTYTGDVMTGQRPLTERGVTEAALELAGGAAGAGLLAGPKGGAILAQNVWHGGPHRWAPEPGFPHGRPRLDKIGTGEGNAAYGHGFYGAEVRNIADKQYRERLSRGDVLMKKDGTPVIPTGADTADEVFASFASGYGDLDAAAKSLKEQIAMLDDGTSIYHSMRRDPEAPTPDQLRAKYAEALEWFGKNRDDLQIDRNHGTLYKLDLPDEDVAKYLDWDAPLFAQPEPVKAALRELGDEDLIRSIDNPAKWTVEPSSKGDKWIVRNVWGEHAGTFKDKAKAQAKADEGTWRHGEGGGQLAYLKLGGNTLYGDTAGAKAASEALRARGIPGLKYFDGMSRGKGEGTRNYVTWDQDVLDRTKMLERNGEVLGANKAPAAAPLGLLDELPMNAAGGVDKVFNFYFGNQKIPPGQAQKIKQIIESHMVSDDFAGAERALLGPAKAGVLEVMAAAKKSKAAGRWPGKINLRTIDGVASALKQRLGGGDISGKPYNSRYFDVGESGRLRISDHAATTNRSANNSGELLISYGDDGIRFHVGGDEVVIPYGSEKLENRDGLQEIIDLLKGSESVTLGANPATAATLGLLNEIERIKRERDFIRSGGA